MKSKTPWVAITLLILGLVIYFSYKVIHPYIPVADNYVSDYPTGDGENISPENPSIPFTDQKGKEQIIIAKLAVYDAVVSKDAKKVRAVLADVQKAQNSVTGEQGEHPLLQYDDKTLTELLSQAYLNQYGTRENFEKDLRSASTKFSLEDQDERNHVNITLPTVTTNTNGRTDNIRFLDAYYMDGKWY